MKRTILYIALLSQAIVLGQSLEYFIVEAENNNPGLQAFALRYQIAEEKIQEVASLPDTEIGAGLFISEPETRTGAQKVRFSVRQMVPWFGTITARENYAASMAEAEYEEVAIVKRQLGLTIAQTYYMLYAIDKKQQVLEDNIKLLKTYEQLALTSIEVGNASAVDVLRLQIRQNELLQRKQVLQQDYRSAQAKLNKLLNRTESIAIVLEDSLAIPHQDPIPLSDSLKLHPEILKYDRLYESVTQSELLNQKEGGPKLGFGLDYIPVAERTDMNPIDNGKDIIMPMVSFSIPIFNKAYGSRTRQNELRQQELGAMRMERKNALESMLATALANRNAARIAHETQMKNLKQAQDAEDILISNYQTGTIDFNDVLDIQELQLNFQLNKIEATVNYFTQAAVINYLITHTYQH